MDTNLGDELEAEPGRPSSEWLERTGLLQLYGKATYNIWAMMVCDGLIGLDTGDSGVMYLTKEQAKDVIAAAVQCFKRRWSGSGFWEVPTKFWADCTKITGQICLDLDSRVSFL